MKKGGYVGHPWLILAKGEGKTTMGVYKPFKHCKGSCVLDDDKSRCLSCFTALYWETQFNKLYEKY